MNLFSNLRSVAVNDTPCVEWDLHRTRNGNKEHWVIRLVGFAGMLPTTEQELNAIMSRPNVELQVMFNGKEMSRCKAEYMDARSILCMAAEAHQSGYDFA